MDIVKRKVFISYYHKDDQFYKDEFLRLFNGVFINKSVNNGDIDSDLSTEYIKRLIQQDYISDASVVIVLIGKNTFKRKHVDWEISAALNSKVGRSSALIGILLPTYPLALVNKYNDNDIPARLNDNLKSGYARIFNWDYVCSDPNKIYNIVNEVFNSKRGLSGRIDNRRLQMIRNVGE